MKMTFPPATMNVTNSTPLVPPSNEYHTALLVIYSVVLLCGTISLSLMMHILKCSAVSTTSVAVLNLIFAHFIFLFTLPFRIYYHAVKRWELNPELCRLVSAMIHVHMYMSFILYVIILVSRLLTFYQRATPVGSFQRMHAVICSVLAWLVVTAVVLSTIYFYYGTNISANSTCFRFGQSVDSVYIKAMNYILSTVIIISALALIALQTRVLWVLYRKHHTGCTSQQDFAAQLKSLFFALIMVICFLPYHVFRIYYMRDISNLENINELFLSLTTFNCLDMLTFLSGRTCDVCMLRRRV